MPRTATKGTRATASAGPTRAGTVVTTVQDVLGSRRREIGGVLWLGAACWVHVALIGYRADDPTSLHPLLSEDAEVLNPCGPLGAEVADALYTTVGLGAWAIAVPGLVLPIFVLARRRMFSWAQWFWATASWLMVLAALDLALAGADLTTFRPGGVVGAAIASSLVNVIGVVGAWVALVTTLAAAASLIAGVSWGDIAHAVTERVEAEMPAVRARARDAGGTLWAWTWAGIRGAGHLVVVGLAAVGNGAWAALAAIGRWVVDALGRGKAAMTRDTTVPTLDPSDWRELSGLQTLPPGSDATRVAEPLDVLLHTLPGLPTSPGTDDAVDGEVAYEPTEGAEVDALLDLFPDLGPREAEVAPAAKAPAKAPAARANVAAVLDDARVERQAMTPPAPAPAPAPAVAKVAPPAPPKVASPRVATPSDAPADGLVPDEDDVDEEEVTATRSDKPKRDLKVEMVGDVNAAPPKDDGASVSDHGNLYFELPALSLLDPVPEQRAQIDQETLSELAETVEETLASFKVTGEVTNVRVGPVVTIFEFLPDPGIKVRRVANLADDLAMALRAKSVRVVAPIPGKGVVGIEVPSQNRLTIFLRELMASPEFRKSEAALPVVIGKDVEGKAMVSDLAKMPHVLVGGTTGSGKSVGVNGMLLSLLYTRTPDELRLLLIDPKKLEFEAYSGVPHLLHPVVTEPSMAAAALAWACREMDRRYELLSQWKTRSIGSFNKKLERELRSWNSDKAWKYAPKDYANDLPPPPPEPLPYIVIVIDELADLMMVAKKDVQDSIVRLAQMARACGMHLIVATQRPSVDVVTGLIKTNMPTRISFKLRSVVDSRTILDQGGAEKLLGRGDMLMLPNAGEVRRVHGAFVSDEEVVRVIDFLKEQREPDFVEGVMASVESDSDGGDFDDPELEDELYDDAVNLVVDKGKASTSMVQRHLRIGYNRAARLIDAMEAAGVVGPADGARPRDVLVGPHGG